MGKVNEPGVSRCRRTTRSAGATRSLGERLGRLLSDGDVVALMGELGAGKTQFVRGLCRGAGVPDAAVSSPTFAIVATYRGRLQVNHADLYRIGDDDELYATGFHDLVGGPGATVVEWADRVPGALPAERLEIAIAHDVRRPGVRHLAIAGVGPRHSALALALRPGSRPRRAPRRGAPPSRPSRPRARG